MRESGGQRRKGKRGTEGGTKKKKERLGRKTAVGGCQKCGESISLKGAGRTRQEK